MTRTSGLLLCLLVFSGCLEGPPAAKPQATTMWDDPSDLTPERRHRSVIALIGEIGSPYASAFHSSGLWTSLDPSTYLKAAPSKPLFLSLDKQVPTEAENEDQGVLEDLQPDTLYWVPGTKIVGMIGFGAAPRWTDAGTEIAARAVGAHFSLASPDTLLVQAYVAPGSDPSEAIRWASSQSWIDVQIHTWDPRLLCAGPSPSLTPGPKEALDAALKSEQVLVMALPATNADGCMRRGFPPEIVVVGEIDNDLAPVPPATQVVDVVSDSCGFPSPDPDRAHGTRPARASHAATAAYVAGALGRLIEEARRTLNDTSTGVRPGGLLAKNENGSLPDGGPLATGTFFALDLRGLLRETALSPITQDTSDGQRCAAWPGVPASAVPAPGLFASIGYGEVNEASILQATKVLLGDEGHPLRPEFKIDVWTRQARVVWGLV